MRTKVSVICDRMLEAGWLLALIVVPLFFNVYSSRVFEPDKLTLLRSLAVIMACAWVIKLVEDGRTPATDEAGGGGDRSPRNWLHKPLTVVTLLYLLVYLFATVVSVVPGTSFRGSYPRLQGTYTTLSYIVVFLVILHSLQEQAQLRRLYTVIVIASLPVALYGLMQHYQLDPLPWGGDVTQRVAANMGNPIFVGAYLLMVIPVTLARLIRMQTSALGTAGRRKSIVFGLFVWTVTLLQLWSWVRLGFVRGIASGMLAIIMFCLVAAYLGRPVGRFVLLGTYAFVLNAQLTCLIFSQSRGPLLGMLVALFFFLLLYAFYRRWRRAVLGFIASAVVVLCFLAVLNLPNSPLASLRQVPYLGRFGQLLETQGGTGKVRLLIWEGALDMLKSDPVRALIGYGPEAMYVAYTPYYPAELAQLEARNASPDRSHNETFDSIIMTGVLGFVVYLVLFGRALHYGLSRLGLVGSRHERLAFAGACVGGGVLGIAVPSMLDGSLRLAGVGLPLGIVAGAGAYTAIAAALHLHRSSAEPGESVDVADSLRGNDLLFIAMFAAVVGHFVEINFGIAVAATRTYFWSYLALLVILGERFGRGQLATLGPSTATLAATERPTTTRNRSRRKRRAADVPPVVDTTRNPQGLLTQLLAIGLLVGFVLMTCAWDYTTNPVPLSSPLQILATALTTMAASGRRDVTNVAMLYLFLSTLIVPCLLAVAELAQDRDKARSAMWWLRSLAIVGGIALLTSLAYALVHARALAPGADAPGLIGRYYLLTAIVLAALVAILYIQSARPAQFSSSALAIIYPVLIVACLFLIDSSNVRIIKADIIYKQGLKYDQAANWDYAIHFYGQAVDVAPREDYYRLFLGRVLMEKAKTAADTAQSDEYFDAAQNSLLEARRLNPLNTDPYGQSRSPQQNVG